MTRSDAAHAHAGARPSTRCAFTLIELLVVIALIALLVSILLPSLAGARQAARATKCLSQVRTLQVAHALYMHDYKDFFIDAGLAHGGPGDPARSWFTTLADYYASPVVVHSPGDRSVYWPVEQGGQGQTVSGRPRVTSYGLNNWLSRTYNPGLHPREPFDRLSRVPHPAKTVQFLLMTEVGAFAVSDHTHAEGWDPGPANAPPALASAEVKTHAWGGRVKSWEAVSNYGYLDGHAEQQAFAGVFTSKFNNRFDPTAAR